MRQFSAIILVLITTLSCSSRPSDSNSNNSQLQEDLPHRSLRELAAERDIEMGSAFYFREGFDPEEYSSRFLENFANLTPEDGIIFRLIKPNGPGDANFQIPDEILGFARDNNLPVRGHHLVWHHYHDGGYLLPPWLLEGEFSREEIEEIMKDYVQSTILYFEENYPGQVKWWSVVNEAVANTYPGEYMPSFWYDNLGEEYIHRAFVYAREVAPPDTKLYYNDYFIEGLPQMPYKADFAYEMVKGLVDRGTPIDAVGMQCHFKFEHYPGKEEMQFIIQRYLDLGLEVYLTEIDIQIEGEITQEKLEEQARIYRELLELCIDNAPHMTYSLWGFNDAQTYLGEAHAPVIMDSQYQPKPAYYAIEDTLLNYFPGGSEE